MRPRFSHFGPASSWSKFHPFLHPLSTSTSPKDSLGMFVRMHWNSVALPNIENLPRFAWYLRRRKCHRHLRFFFAIASTSDPLRITDENFLNLTNCFCNTWLLDFLHMWNVRLFGIFWKLVTKSASKSAQRASAAKLGHFLGFLFGFLSIWNSCKDPLGLKAGPVFLLTTPFPYCNRPVRPRCRSHAVQHLRRVTLAATWAPSWILSAQLAVDLTRSCRHW